MNNEARQLIDANNLLGDLFSMTIGAGHEPAVVQTAVAGLLAAMFVSSEIHIEGFNLDNAIDALSKGIRLVVNDIRTAQRNATSPDDSGN